jgi:serine/threonine-protein kinase
LTVTRNGQAVPGGAYGVALPSDPGEQRIEARAPGRITWSTQVELGAQSAMLVVDVPELAVDPVSSQPTAAAAVEPAAAPRPEASAAPVAAVSASPEPRAGWQRPLGYVLGGAGIVALGVGSYFGLRAIDKNGDLESACKTDPCNASLRSLQDSRNSAATASTVVFIGGAALLGAGAVLVFTAPSERALAASLQGEPGGARLSLRGRF